MPLRRDATIPPPVRFRTITYPPAPEQRLHGPKSRISDFKCAEDFDCDAITLACKLWVSAHPIEQAIGFKERFRAGWLVSVMGRQPAAPESVYRRHLCVLPAPCTIRRGGCGAIRSVP